MKIIESNIEYIPQDYTLEGIYSQIERAGRVCYASFPKYSSFNNDLEKMNDFYSLSKEEFLKAYSKITEQEYDETNYFENLDRIKKGLCPSDNFNSTYITEAHKFVDTLIKSKHLSPLEHGTVYLKYETLMSNLDRDYIEDTVFNTIVNPFVNNPYSKVNILGGYNSPIGLNIYTTTNLRVILENKDIDLEDLKDFICLPTKYHEKRYSFEVICSIGVSREWNRHRTLSVSEQSTRYCNFNKDKFHYEIFFIKPYWYNEENAPINNFIKKTNQYSYISEYYFNISEDELDNIGENDPREFNFHTSIETAEAMYINMIRLGCKPQEAREVLPLCTATKVFYTGFKSDWKHWLELRDSNAAHPDIRKFTPYIKEIVNK